MGGGLLHTRKEIEEEEEAPEAFQVRPTPYTFATRSDCTRFSSQEMDQNPLHQNDYIRDRINWARVSTGEREPPPRPRGSPSIQAFSGNAHTETPPLECHSRRAEKESSLNS